MQKSAPIPNLRKASIRFTSSCLLSPRNRNSCSCGINPLAPNSLQKKNPLNFQLNFSPVTNKTASSVPPCPSLPLRLCPGWQAPGGAGAGASAGGRRPHGNHPARNHGNALLHAARNTGGETCRSSTCENTLKLLKHGGGGRY